MAIDDNLTPVDVKPHKPIHWIERTAIGIMGGLAAAASKVIGLDAQIAAALLDSKMFGSAHDLKVMILIHTPILMALGGMLAYMIEENVRIKIFAIGVSAPALITPWLSSPVVKPLEDLRAESGWFELAPTAWANDHAGATTPTSGRLEGLEYLLKFNTNDDPSRRYWVIVGSHTDISEANKQVAAIKAVAPELQPFVGLRKENNRFYPVIIGGTRAYLPLKQARDLQKLATSLGDLAPSGAYLSDYPNRVP